MKSKFIAMVLTAIGLASFSLSSCTSSTPKEEDYYDPEHKPFGKYDEVVKVKGVMEFLAHNDSRVPSDITPETNVFIKKLKEDMNYQQKRLQLPEVLTALSICSATNPIIEKCLSNLKKLKDCEAHATYIVDNGDKKTLKSLKINLTCEPEYLPTEDLDLI